MAIELINTLKAWFQEGDEPTEAQFAALIDSMMHRTDGAKLPIDRVKDLQALINGFATTQQVNNALNRSGHTGTQALSTVTGLVEALAAINTDLSQIGNNSVSSIFTEETEDYILHRFITNAKLIAYVKLKPLRDINQTFDIEICPAGIADWFIFQMYRQIVETNGVNLEGQGSEFGTPTVDFNKLVDEDQSESFALLGRGYRGYFAVIEGFDHLNYGAGGSPLYVGGKKTVNVRTEGVTMTIDKTLSKEIESEYTFVIEATLAGVAVPNQNNELTEVEGGSASDPWGSAVVDGGDASNNWNEEL